jgi:hypothetical protein
MRAITESHHFSLRRRDGGQCVNDTPALLVVTRALVQSYPSWTDENGTNVEQLAAIAVTALEAEGLLVTADLTRDVPEPSPGDAVDATTISLP